VSVPPHTYTGGIIEVGSHALKNSDNIAPQFIVCLFVSQRTAAHYGPYSVKQVAH